jgi:hypothetical protein
MPRCWNPGARLQGETVAAAAQGLDHPEAPVRIQLAPQPPDQHLDHVALAIRVVFVEIVGQHVLAQRPPRLPHQLQQQPVLEGRQGHGLTAQDHRVGGRIDHQRAEIQPLLAILQTATHQRPQPRLQFLHVERLGQVVVGTRLQALHLVLPAVPGGQDQDRQARLLGPGAADQVQAVEPGQTEVHDGDVAGVFGQQVQAGLAVGGQIDPPAGAKQRLGDALPKAVIVLDQGHAQVHGRAPSAPSMVMVRTCWPSVSSRIVYTTPPLRRSPRADSTRPAWSRSTCATASSRLLGGAAGRAPGTASSSAVSSAMAHHLRGRPGVVCQLRRMFQSPGPDCIRNARLPGRRRCSAHVHVLH